MDHISVLKDEVLELMDLKGGEIVVDGTLGLGGHALEILKRIGKSGKLIAFEQDERNLMEAKKRLKPYEKQIVYLKDNFRYLKSRITESKSASQVDVVFLDLGLSSPHVDDSERGFSFMKDGPLDMRFDQNMKLTAADILNSYSESDLADIFYNYGEERMSRRVARQICERRKVKEFSSTLDLAQFLQSVLPQKWSKKGKSSHPATKIFQALRIAVNDELNVLHEVLEQSMELIRIGGRIVVISYHSLEDRIVKQFFKNLEKPPVKTQQEALYRNYADPIVESLSKKPVIPTAEEISGNPRSRSAKLRAYKKIREQ